VVPGWLNNLVDPSTSHSWYLNHTLDVVVTASTRMDETSTSHFPSTAAPAGLQVSLECQVLTLSSARHPWPWLGWAVSGASVQAGAIHVQY